MIREWFCSYFARQRPDPGPDVVVVVGGGGGVVVICVVVIVVVVAGGGVIVCCWSAHILPDRDLTLALTVACSCLAAFYPL